VWQGAQVLAPTDPHAWWLDAVCLAVLQGDLRAAFDRYRAVAAAFREAGDLVGELAAGSAAAVLARRLDDVGALLAFIGRAGEMVAEGHAAAMGPALLGEALVAQLGGDHAGAVEALSRLPGDALVGDWAAQVAMVRGTNLLLLDRSEEAIEQLVAATGWSGAWSSARALELLAQARWRAGDAVGALDDLRAAEELAASVAAADLVTSVRSCRAVMATVAGRHDAPELVARVDERGPLEGEALRMATIARVLAAVDGGDLAGARALLATVDPVPRALASTHWCIALQVALGEATPDAWAPVVADHPALRGPLAAGIAGLRHLDEGAPIERPHHRYLPSTWCAGAVSVVEICLLGVPSIRRDGRVVEHPAWERARVRELAARLALVGPSARDQIAADLWPDLDGPAAARNLRVNLTHLLDAIDPDRPKGEGSRWVVDRSGAFGFADDDTLRIDVREVERSARAIVAAASLEDDPAVVAAARRFIRHRDGPLLGGAALGAWVEPYEQAWETLSLRAVSLAGEAALRVGDPRLAEDLGRRGLRADPWAERLHQLVVRACLARDDLDAARRELRRAAAALAELGVRPEPATWSLARLVGMRLDA
jgi:DNA-binding SARP family transcriptional activator